MQSLQEQALQYLRCDGNLWTGRPGRRVLRRIRCQRDELYPHPLEREHEGRGPYGAPVSLAPLYHRIRVPEGSNGPHLRSRANRARPSLDPPRPRCI